MGILCRLKVKIREGNLGLVNRKLLWTSEIFLLELLQTVIFVWMNLYLFHFASSSASVKPIEMRMLFYERYLNFHTSIDLLTKWPYSLKINKSTAVGKGIYKYQLLSILLCAASIIISKEFQIFSLSFNASNVIKICPYSTLWYFFFLMLFIHISFALFVLII